MAGLSDLFSTGLPVDSAFTICYKFINIFFSMGNDDMISLLGRGGATKREGGRQVKFYPYKRGGGGSHAEGGGGTNSFKVVLTQELEFKPF